MLSSTTSEGIWKKDISGILSWASLGFFLVPLIAFITVSTVSGFMTIMSPFLLTSLFMWAQPFPLFPKKIFPSLSRWFMGWISGLALFIEIFFLALRYPITNMEDGYAGFAFIPAAGFLFLSLIALFFFNLGVLFFKKYKI